MRELNTLSTPKAYVLCIFGGYFGLHRFYLGRSISGAIYLFTFGLLGLGVLLDLVLLPSLTRKSKIYLAAVQADSYTTLDAVPQLYEPALSLDRLDPFRSRVPLLSTIRMANLCIWLFIIPYLSLVFYQDWIFTTTFALIILSTTSSRLVAWLAKAPITSILFRGFFLGYQRLEMYYRHTLPPRFSIPILSTLLFFLSARGRTEFKLFKGLASFGILFVILEWVSLVYEYMTLYYPELGVASILEAKLFTMLITVLILISSALPVMRTLVYAKLSNRQQSVSIITSLAFLALCLMVTQPHVEYTQEDYVRFEKRFKTSASFRAKIEDTIQTFIDQEVNDWRPRRDDDPHRGLLSRDPHLSSAFSEIFSPVTPHGAQELLELKTSYLDQETRRLLLLNHVGITFYLEQSKAWRSSIRSRLSHAGVLDEETSILRVLLFTRDLDQRRKILFDSSKYIPTSMNTAADLFRPISYQGDTLAHLTYKRLSPLKLTQDEALEAINHALSEDVLRSLMKGTFLLIFDGFNDADIERPRIYKLHRSSPRAGAPSPQKVERMRWDQLNRVARVMEIKEMYEGMIYFE